MKTATLEAPTTRTRPRWTIARVATDLAIIMIVVPSVIDYLSPMPRGFCGMTEGFMALSMGMAILGLRGFWIVLKFLNDAGERLLNLPNSPLSSQKPQPLDDF